MKILFSPSEEKINSLNACNIDELKIFFTNLNLDNLSIKSQFRKSYIKEYINHFDNLELIFGVKNTQNILNNFSNKLYKAIILYQGVSYKELDYNSLSNEEKTYIDDNVIIFSNLFGPILANDEIPFYKLKQGVKLNKINQAKEYLKDTTNNLNEIIKEFAIDLRADIYKDYYQIQIPHATFIFMKNNKQLSHSSKVYRGRVLRLLAQNNITNIKELSNMIYTNFSVINIENIENKTIFYIDIKD
ncbi:MULTISPECIES: peroxide stress protein YaaA [unclassified Campylobacter]|uniref:peroxide stress protein YaaA n=2 Tax=Campylobacter TaxID=194 RepID=UPI001BDA3283|nr:MULTISPECIES: peroxide stress protein YaaA [unclassified Campylobacter]MBZ7976870.1 peroxide stress protein YaaA [Campylobacter sp. RM12637]MBZ7980537.1 peroxide stress protein YaaA [Campylobacter sp. RM12642]MBZ8007744.1 peroxide stress protein YaaA [Campylobacter sp. RM9334]MBT0885246.1 peroxide stress protein YaaA [Campylobacter sp. 2018MI10]ULO02578.1 peroxide stress protein YaaA [Campylobacter sp. RM12651]